MLSPDVARAIQNIRDAFPESTIVVREDADGGAWVIVEQIEIGPLYEQEKSWFGFHITYPYPSADIYPHFARGDLARSDRRVLGAALSTGHTFLDRPAVQISRRSNRLDPKTDTALHKLLKVIEFVRTHP